MVNVNDLARIAANGGGLILDGTQFNVDDLARIAANAKPKQSDIIIRNASSMTVDGMARIAANGSGCVVFDLTT
jgi:hypothetical protein